MENKLITYFVAFTRNGGKWKYQEIKAENPEQAKVVFMAGIKGMIERIFYKTMTKAERESELNKFKVITATELTPTKKEQENANRKS